MTETPGTILQKAFNLNPQRVKDFDRSLNRKLDLVLFALVKGTFDNTIEKIKYRPEPDDAILHNYIMQSNRKPQGIKSFKKFQSS